MHKTSLLTLFAIQSITLVQGVGQESKESDSPRIQPMPINITYETKHKPPLQEAPPSSFIPPTQSGGSGKNFDPKGTFKPKSTFDPQGSFNPAASSSQKSPPAIRPSTQPPSTQVPSKQPASSATRFSTVDPTTTKPLRSQTDSPRKRSLSSQSPTTNPPANGSIRLQDDTSSKGASSNWKQAPTSNTAGGTNTTLNNTSPTANSSIGNRSLGSRSALSRDARGVNSRSLDSGAPDARTVPEVPQEQPATIETRTVDDASFDPQMKEIADMILTSVRRPETNRLSLAKAVSNARSSANRKQIAKQYWTCFVTAADLQNAQQELQLLGTISNAGTQLDQLRLRAAISSARARLAEAKLAYKKSSTSLFKLAPYFDLDQPISFADLPWVGKYKTNSDNLAKTGMFDQKIKQVDVALPSIRDLIYLRGAAVYDNLLAFRKSIDGLAGGAVKLDTVLRLHEETRDQRIEFFKNVQKYNHAIADYAISVFPNANHPEVVANMLVDTQKTLPTNDTILDPNVRQASSNQPERRDP